MLGGSKASINFFTKILAKELKIYGIKVNAIAPTILKNKMEEKTDINTAKLLLKSSSKNGYRYEISCKQNFVFTI